MNVPTLPFIYLCNNNQLNNTQNIVTEHVLHFYWSFTRLWMLKFMGLLFFVVLFCTSSLSKIYQYHSKVSIWNLNFFYFCYSGFPQICYTAIANLCYQTDPASENPQMFSRDGVCYNHWCFSETRFTCSSLNSRFMTSDK